MNRPFPTRRRSAPRSVSSFILSSLLSFPPLPTSLAEARRSTREQRLKELEQKVDVLTKEIESLRLGETAPTEKAAVSPPTLGLGPAASKVYSKHGVSIGGYGEILYQNFSASREDGSASGLTPTIDLARAVLYFGYKFDDHFVFNSEIEYEHAVTASDKEGEVEVEFAYLDWLERQTHLQRARRARPHPRRSHQPAPRAAGLPRGEKARRGDGHPAVHVARDRPRGLGRRGPLLVPPVPRQRAERRGVRGGRPEGRQPGRLQRSRARLRLHGPPRLRGPAGRARGRVVLHGQLRPGAGHAGR